VATISRLLKIVGLFGRISSLLLSSFAKETDFKELTNGIHPIGPPRKREREWEGERGGQNEKKNGRERAREREREREKKRERVAKHGEFARRGIVALRLEGLEGERD